MRVATKSELRVRKAKRYFKDLFGTKFPEIKVEFVNVIGTEEAQFKVSDNENEIWVTFYGNDLMTSANWEMEN